MNFYSCPIHATQRETLINSIERGFISTKTPIHLRNINNLAILMGSDPELLTPLVNIIRPAIGVFLQTISAKI